MTLKQNIMNSIIAKLNEGGPLFMYTTLIVLFVIIGLFVYTLVKPNNPKGFELIQSFGWFAIVWGFLGQSLGLIGAFDAVQAAGDISPSLVAAGLKVALLSPLFGMLTFLFARIFMIILIVLRKEKAE